MVFQNIIISNQTTASNILNISNTACFHEVCRIEFMTGVWKKVCCHCGTILDLK